MSFSVQVLLIGADRGNPIGSATMAHLLPRGPVRSNAEPPATAFNQKASETKSLHAGSG